MAIKLRAGMTFTPSVQAQYGVVLGSNDYYGVIDGLEYNKRMKHAAFSLEIYASKAARDAARQEGGSVAPVEVLNKFYSGEQFDVDIGNNGFTITQAYQKALAAMPDWESDEV